MCTVILPLSFNPSMFKKCINTSTKSLGVNVYYVTDQRVNPTAVNKCIYNINIAFVCKYLLCYCHLVLTQLQLTNVRRHQHKSCV